MNKIDSMILGLVIILSGIISGLSLYAITVHIGALATATVMFSVTIMGYVYLDLTEGE